MGAERGSRAVAVAVRDQLSWLWSRYQPSDLRTALQVAVGWALLLGAFAPSAAWDRLEELGASLTLILIVYLLLCQPVVGGSTLAWVLGVVAFAAATGLSFIPIGLAYAAGGGSGGTATEAKAVVLVAATAVMAGLLSVARMRFEKLDLVFYGLTYGSVVAVFGFYWELSPVGVAPLPYISKVQGYWAFLSISLVGAALLPVAWLVWPNPAGRVARRTTCSALRSIGRLGSGLVQLVVGSDDADGKQPPGQKQGAEAVEPAEAEAELAAKMREELVALQQALQKLPLLLITSRAEVDVYGQQKSFAAGPYSRVAAHAGAAATCLGLALRPLVREAAPELSALGVVLPPSLPVDLSACRAVAPQLLAMQAALQGCCEALAATVEHNAPYEEALERLAEMESSWRALAKAAVGVGGPARPAVSLRVLLGLLMATSLHVRAMYEEIALAVGSAQPGAAAQAAAHFKAAVLNVPLQLAAASQGQGSTSAVLAISHGEGNSGSGEGGLSGNAAPSATGSQPAPQEVLAAPGAAGLAADEQGQQDAAVEHAGGGEAQPAVVVEVDGSPPAANGTAGPPPPAAPVTPPTPTAVPSITRPTAEVAQARGVHASWVRLWDRMERAGVGSPQLRPGLHLALAVAISGPLVTIWDVMKAFDYKTIWVVISVNSVFERCVGNVLSRSVNRILGTVIGLCWSLAVIALSFLANGSSWQNSAAKYATMACLVTLWGVFVGANRNRHPKYAYSWSVMSSTVCVVVLEGFKDVEPPWELAGFRAACVAMGVALDLLVSSLVFPVSAEMLQRQQLQRALLALASLAQQVAATQQGHDWGAPEWEQHYKKMLATDKQVRGAALKLSQLQDSARLESKYWPGGPMGSSGDGSQLSRVALAAVRDYVMQMCDLLIVVAHMRRQRLMRSMRPLTPAHKQLSQAVADQLDESLQALRLALGGTLPMAAALRTLPALDDLVHLLAGEVEGELVAEQEEYERQQAQQAAGQGAEPAGDACRRRPAMAFAAAALGSARLLRRLYHAAAVAVLPHDPAAVAATEAALREAGYQPQEAATEQAAMAVLFSPQAQAQEAAAG